MFISNLSQHTLKRYTDTNTMISQTLNALNEQASHTEQHSKSKLSGNEVYCWIAAVFDGASTAAKKLAKDWIAPNPTGVFHL